MSRFTDQLRTIRIFNAHNFAGNGNVYISYTPRGDGRSMHSPEWGIYRPGYQTDPGAPWYDYGNKKFLLFTHGATHAERKAAALALAKGWASQKYGITNWAKTPFGDWMEAEFVKNRTAALKRLLSTVAKEQRQRA